MQKSGKKWRVFISRKIPDNGVRMLKKAGFSVEMNNTEDKILSKKELIKKVKGKDVLLSFLSDKIDEELLSSDPNLKIVSNYAVGFDNIDLEASTRHKVAVTNTAGTSSVSVAEHTIALMFAVAKRLNEGDEFMRASKYKFWKPSLMSGKKLEGKTLGIIGLGRIGTEVAKRALCMGMKVIYYTRTRKPAFEKRFGAKYRSLHQLLKSSDVVSLHTPLTPKTHHLIGKKEFALMKKDAIFINTSRGSVADEKALCSALSKGKLMGAGLDVYEFEPKVTAYLMKCTKALLTPHSASATPEARADMARVAAQSIIDFSRGKTPKNLINKEVLKK